MALINCPECGQQMSDTTRKCPHCGYKIPRDPKKEYGWLIGIGIILLSLLGFVLSFALMTNFSTAGIRYYEDCFIWGCVVFVISVGFLYGGCYFLNKSRANILFIGILSISIAFLIATFCLMDMRFIDSNEDTYIERNDSVNTNDNYKRDTSRKNRREGNLEACLGTWVYQQPGNPKGDKTLTIIINEDKTVRAICQGENGDKTFYGSWYQMGGYDNKPFKIIMSFNDTRVYVPRYGNHGGGYVSELRAYKGNDESFDLTNAALQEGFLYDNESSASAKNPEKRVAITKQ